MFAGGSAGGFEGGLRESFGRVSITLWFLVEKPAILVSFKSLNQVKKVSKSCQFYKHVESGSFDLVRSSGLTTQPDRLDELRIRVCCQRKVLGS